MTQMLSDGLSINNIAQKIFTGIDFETIDSDLVSYKCTCSRDRMEKVLISLGKDELLRLAEEQETTEIVCHFCNKKYLFSDEELRSLIQ